MVHIYKHTPIHKTFNKLTSFVIASLQYILVGNLKCTSPPPPPAYLGIERRGVRYIWKVPGLEVYLGEKKQIKITSRHSCEARHDFARPNGEDSQDC